MFFRVDSWIVGLGFRRNAALCNQALFIVPIKLRKQFADLLVVPEFVVTNEGHGSSSIDLSQKWVIKDDLFQFLFSLSGAEFFKTVTRSVVIFDHDAFLRRIGRCDSPRRLYADKSRCYD